MSLAAASSLAQSWDAALRLRTALCLENTPVRKDLYAEDVMKLHMSCTVDFTEMFL